jgi:peptidyl-prolyl cis-trans isomerase D
MLRTIHRYRLIFLIILVLSSIALAFSGFAYSWISPYQERHAIAIDDTSISFRDIENERRELDRIFRQQFGPQYFRILSQLNINVPQQAVDRAIQNALLTREATRIGFASGPRAVANQLAAKFGSMPNPREQYSAFLDSIQMTSQEFERRLEESLLRAQLEQLIQNASIPSERELAAAVRLEKTKYSVSYVSLSGDSFLSEVPDPSADAIAAYYEDNASDFEIPARVSYSFVDLEPSKFLDVVELFEDDVEIYYTDHEHEYTTPERRTVRVLEVRAPAPKDASAAKPETVQPKEPAQPEKTKEQIAEELLVKLSSGAMFADLAKQHSAHESASNGGLLESATEQELAAKLGAASAQEVFALPQGKPQVLSAGSAPGAFIALVEEIAPLTITPLSEVRASIEEKIRAREAPAFVAAKAEEWLEEWRKQGIPLKDFILSEQLAPRNLALKDSGGLREASQDPPDYTGLSAKVLEQVDDRRLLLDLGDKIVLAEVSEFKAPEVQTLEQVTPTIIAELRKSAAAARAKEVAQLIVDGLRSGTHKSLEQAAAASGQALLKMTDLTRDQTTAPFNENPLKRAVFSAQEAPLLPTGVLTKDGQHFVVQVDALSPPTETEVLAGIKEEREEEANALSGLVLASMLNHLKANSKIDIRAGVIGQGS